VSVVTFLSGLAIQFPISHEAAMSATLCGNEPVSPHTSKTEQPQRENNGRDTGGRFAAGNIGGPGNPFARRVAQFRQVLHECCSIEDMRDIGGQLVALSKMGDVAATKLLLQYQVGKPVATVDPDALDLQELALFQRGPTPDEIHALTSGQRLPPEAWMGVLRVCLPVIVQQFHDVFRNIFEREDAARATGETLDTDEVVEDAIDEVLGRTAEDEEKLQREVKPNEHDNPAEQATASTHSETDDDPRPTATRPSTNGHFRGTDTRQTESDNCDDEGRGDVPRPLRPCPLCRK
jgi:hypothetical protein